MGSFGGFYKGEKKKQKKDKQGKNAIKDVYTIQMPELVKKKKDSWS